MFRNYAASCTVALRLACFACTGLLVALSWLPGTEMVRTGVNGRLEHAVAYFGTAVVMALAYRVRPALAFQAALLVLLAAVLEIGQLYVPGRHSAVLDFGASSLGCLFGGLVMWAMRPRLLLRLGLDDPSAGR